MDRVDSNFLQRCYEVGRRRGPGDDSGDGPRQLLYLVVIDKSDLLEVTNIKVRYSELGDEAGPTCTVGAPQ